MKDETSTWLRYAEENLAVARLSFEQGFFHACLQNAQQCVEKALKAIIIENGLTRTVSPNGAASNHQPSYCPTCSPASSTPSLPGRIQCNPGRTHRLGMH